MILVGVPYSTQELFTTMGGGSPYGPGHVAGDDNQRQIDEQEAAIIYSIRRRRCVERPRRTHTALSAPVQRFRHSEPGECAAFQLAIV